MIRFGIGSILGRSSDCLIIVKYMTSKESVPATDEVASEWIEKIKAILNSADRSKSVRKIQSISIINRLRQD